MNYRKQKLSTKDINLFILNKINYHLKKKSNLYAYIHKIISFIVFFFSRKPVKKPSLFGQWKNAIIEIIEK